MRKRAKADMVLLQKIFEQDNMTSREMEELLGLSWGALRRIRREMGFGEQGKIKCNVCGEQKDRNLFSFKFPGVCIICRRKTDDSIPGGGRPKQVFKTARTKCLKCGKPFLTRLGYEDVKVNRICPICSKTNSFLGEQEELISIRI